MTKLLYLIDKLASNWIHWRTGRELEAAKSRDPEMAESWEMRELVVTPDGFDLRAKAPGIVMLANEACALLQSLDAKNFVQFDMYPDPAIHNHPIRITVQNALGMSPATKCAKLEAELAELRAKAVTIGS